MEPDNATNGARAADAQPKSAAANATEGSGRTEPPCAGGVPQPQPSIEPAWLTVVRCVVASLLIMGAPVVLIGMAIAGEYATNGSVYAFALTVATVLAAIGLLLRPGLPGRKAVLAIAVIGAVVAAVAFGVDCAVTNAGYVPAQSEEDREYYRDNIESQEYAPFSSELVARLDEPATLKFGAGEQLPVVDGAAALLPVYSAFVMATYPEDATTVALEEGEGYRRSDAGDLVRSGRDKRTIAAPSIVFQYNNTLLGYESLARGYTDVFFGVHPSDDQLAFAQKECGGLDLTPIGREAFVFIVNADAPVDSLTLDQVKAIYRGDIADWSQVGAQPGPIFAFQRNEGSGSQSQMLRFMNGEPLVEPPKSRVQSLMSGLVSAVASYNNGEGAIGYSFRYYVEGILGERGVKALAIDGVAPTAENISNGSYPITVELYAATRAGELEGLRADGTAANPNIARLVAWAVGPQGQELVEASGYARVG